APEGDALRDREYAIREARAALAADLGSSLGEAEDAHWMDRIGVARSSGSRRIETEYTYDIVTLRPKRPIPDGAFAGRFGWLSAAEIRQSDPDEGSADARMVTWTTWQVLTRLLDVQQVSVAVVSRTVTSGRQWLLTLSGRGYWFFPA